jgi:hypothetical protein
MEKHVAAALLSLLRSLFRFTSLFLWLRALRIIHFSKPTATHRTYAQRENEYISAIFNC